MILPPFWLAGNEISWRTVLGGHGHWPRGEAGGVNHEDVPRSLLCDILSRWTIHSDDARRPVFVKTKSPDASHGFRSMLGSPSITLGKPFPGRRSEVSQGGIAILTVADLTVGEVVELQFKLRQNVLRLRAIIRNRKGARYGMEFLTLSPQQREHIVRLVPWHDPPHISEGTSYVCSSTLVDRTPVTSRLCHGVLTVSSSGHDAELAQLFVPAC